MDGDPVYGLVCAGGGAHGAYQVGVLKYIHEHFCEGEHSPFQVFSGTSAGSLNTGFFAAESCDARAGRLWLEEMWLDFHVPAYHGNVVKNAVLTLLKEWGIPRRLRKQTWSLLDPTPLRDVVTKGFIREHLERSLEAGTTLGLAVSATELRSSRLVWFQDGPRAASWVVPGSTSIETPIGVPHVQASCSVPIAFPPVKIDRYYYADGGVANNRPFTPSINMGATRILSIATDRPLPQELPEPEPGFKPHFADTFRMLLDQLARDYAIDQADTIEIFNYLWERAPESERPAKSPHILFGREVHLGEYQPVEVLNFAPSRRIRHSDIFNPQLFEMPIESNNTVLLFHRDFIRPLIDFGYNDAGARHAELAAFFDRRRPQRRSVFTQPESSS